LVGFEVVGGYYGFEERCLVVADDVVALVSKRLGKANRGGGSR